MSEYRTIVENLSNPVVIFTLEGRIKEVNPAACSFYGYERTELLASTLYDLVSPEQHAIVESTLRRVTDGESFFLMNEDRNQTGEVLYIEVSLAPLTFKDEACGIGIVRDITERHERERILQERTLALAERIKELKTLYSFADLARRRGISIDELLQSTVELIPSGWQYPERTTARIVFGDRSYLSSGFRESELALHQEITLDGEKAGRIDVFLVDHEPDRNGEPFLDEEKALLEALAVQISRTVQQSESVEQLQRYEQIVDSAHDLMSLRDREYRHLAVNEAYLEAFESSRDRIVGQTTADLFGQDIFEEKIRPHFDRCLAGEASRFEAWFDLPGRGRCYLEEAYYPYTAPDGEIVGVVTNSRDLTQWKIDQDERRRLEERLEQARKLESIGVLAGGIAHEFNNLLTGVMGNADMARSMLQSSSPIYSYLERIVASSRRAADLVSQMLAYSGAGQFLVQEIDLSELIIEMKATIDTIVPEGVTLDLHLADDLPVLEADPAQIRQLVKNLVTNATEALDGGQGTVTISAGMMTLGRNIDLSDWAGPGDALPEGPALYLEVADTGEGMNEKTVGRAGNHAWSRRVSLHPQPPRRRNPGAGRLSPARRSR